MKRKEKFCGEDAVATPSRYLLFWEAVDADFVYFVHFIGLCMRRFVLRFLGTMYPCDEMIVSILTADRQSRQFSRSIPVPVS